MATVYGQLSVTFTDALGVPSAHYNSFTTDDAKTLANLQTFANDWFDHVSPLSDAGAEEIRVTIYVAANNPTDPQSGSEVERTGLFNFSQAGIRYKEGIDVPSIANSLISNGKIDLTSTDIQNWITWMTAAHTGFQITSKFVKLLLELLDAVLSFRKKRKLESKRSFEVPS